MSDRCIPQEDVDGLRMGRSLGVFLPQRAHEVRRPRDLIGERRYGQVDPHPLDAPLLALQAADLGLQRRCGVQRSRRLQVQG